MRTSVVLGMATMLLGAHMAVAADAPLKFLDRRDLSTPQDKPFKMEQTSEAVREKNKQVVLDFYKVISDKRQWTEENRKKYFHDDFIQHDPGEPDTSEAFFNFFRTMGAPGGAPGGGAGGPPPEGMGAPAAGMGSGPMGMVGETSFDSNNSPVNFMVAEGDIVVVARHRNWEWKGGPTPVFNGIFVDIWRLEDGKIKEQWCSASPDDAQVAKINQLMKEGKFPKRKEWD